MASKVKVVDSNFRQVEIKVNPATHLTDILEQACAKFKTDPSKHLLKHKQRQLDLSHTWRTSGLVQGAKLELVVKSNTPTAIDVALQLPPPESEAFPPYGRLTEKLSSDITIWKLLRHFESGRPSEGKPLNITGRGVPQMESRTGSGQLYYETPALQVGNRNLATFDDFQKTLSQLGYNSGRVLIRLSFQKTDKTFVDAIADIDRHFQEEKKQTTDEPTASTEAKSDLSDLIDLGEDEPSVTQPATEVTGTTSTPAPTPPETNIQDFASTNTTIPTTNAAQASAASDAMDIDSAVPTSSSATEQNQPPSSSLSLPSSSTPSDAVRIFSAPTSDTPQAALQSDTEDAFVPGIEHAKAHQRLLKAAGQNKRLPSDRELADRDAAERRKLSDAASVRIRVRLPDNSLLERDFGQADTGAALYAVVREAMAHPDAAFRLAIPPLGREAVRDSESVGGGAEDNRLIQGYRFRGQVVVTFVWDDAVPAEVRRAPFLKQSAAARARQVVVPEIPDAVEERGGGKAEMMGGFGDGGGEQSTAPNKRGLDALKGKTPKWLKGLGGKK
ncbi:hypothetical protein MGN70_005349 [Eutypa lata]|nr:hypothetical protein MGN70_005349 [Eutypa lata]